jgi:predicted RNase H-like HicB family nuclease
MKYSIILYWSDEDEAFVAEVPELPGCVAHGDTQEAALERVKEAMTLWVDAARSQGREVPEPGSRRLCYALFSTGNEGEQDPILREIRQIREALSEEFNHDIRALFQHLQQHQALSGRKTVSFAPKRVGDTALSEE